MQAASACGDVVGVRRVACCGGVVVAARDVVLCVLCVCCVSCWREGVVGLMV